MIETQVNPPRIYSPSSRTDFSFCQRYWWLRKRYVTRRISYPELCGIGGSAVSEAMAWWNRARIANRPTELEECTIRGLQHITEALATVHANGRTIIGKDTEMADQLPQLVTTAIKALWDADPLQGHTIVAAEHEFVDFGNARPDVISRNNEKELVVSDYKCKMGKFDLGWTDKEFDKHFHGEQRMAYTQMAGASLFGIILCVIQPTLKGKPQPPQVLHRVSRVMPTEVILWKHDAACDYTRMARVEQATTPWIVPGKAGPHATQYGECPFHGACIEDNLDESRMRVRYLPIEKEGVRD